MADTGPLVRQIVESLQSGDQTRLKALQERYRSEAVLERMGPAPVLTESTRSRATSNGPRRYKNPPLARRVVLSASAREAISDFRHGDGIEETGGALLGMIAGPSIFVDYATEWVHAERSRTSLRHDPDEIPHLEEVYRLPVCGDWHLHPGQSDPKPSGQDRAAWGKSAGEIGHPWASIIVGDNGGVYRPMKAYISHFRGGNTRTTPVPLIEE
jgi:hypothetical protein